MGLYKVINGILSYAENEIIYPDGTKITVSDYVNSTESINGWLYFNTLQEAKTHFNILDEETLEN